MHRKFLAAMFALSSALFAQGPQPPQQPQQPQGPPPTAEVKAFLQLSDPQIQQLRDLTDSMAGANRTRNQEIAQKQQQLNDLLQQGSTDANALGRLLIDIQTLRKQVGATAENFRTQAVALLTDAQKTRLKQLEDSAKLAPAVQQAVSLNLLAPPARQPQGPPAPGGPRPNLFFPIPQ
jgi:hypothetical protein